MLLSCGHYVNEVVCRCFGKRLVIPARAIREKESVFQCRWKRKVWLADERKEETEVWDVSEVWKSMLVSF